MVYLEIFSSLHRCYPFVLVHDFIYPSLIVIRPLCRPAGEVIFIGLLLDADSTAGLKTLHQATLLNQ